MNEAISPARVNNLEDRSADSDCVKPIPCATAPKTPTSCFASDVVKPKRFAFLESSSPSFAASSPNVVPNAPDAS